jgi:hypothetical protein
MIYGRFVRFELAKARDLGGLSAMISPIQTLFMDLIVKISTYSMPNWLCNDLKSADELKKNIFPLTQLHFSAFFFSRLLAELQKYLFFQY